MLMLARLLLRLWLLLLLLLLRLLLRVNFMRSRKPLHVLRFTLLLLGKIV